MIEESPSSSSSSSSSGGAGNLAGAGAGLGLNLFSGFQTLGAKISGFFSNLFSGEEENVETIVVDESEKSGISTTLIFFGVLVILISLLATTYLLVKPKGGY